VLQESHDERDVVLPQFASDGSDLIEFGLEYFPVFGGVEVSGLLDRSVLIVDDLCPEAEE